MKNLLLPFPFKLAGIFLALCGLVFAVLYVWFDFRFTIPVFAVFSSFVETKVFATFRTNFADELTMLLLVTGLGLIVFSKEKNETENLTLVRIKAMANAGIANTFFILFSILFVYGSGFIAILVLNLFSFFIFYLVIFHFLKRKQEDNVRRTK
jgi:hypothetical protein